MNTVLTPNAKNQSISINNKQIRIKTSKKNKRGNFISNTSENFDTYAGLLNLPPPSTLNSKQPPLLPLPHVSTILHHKPLLSRSLNGQNLSLPPQNRKNIINSNRDMSLTPKKSKPKKKEETKKRSGTQTVLSEFLMDNPWGPDPKDLPKHLPVVFTPKVLSENIDDFSESVFSLSPPPSSLPLPKFSIRSKLGCNTEAAAGSFVDAGATNNLRRLLRLR